MKKFLASLIVIVFILLGCVALEHISYTKLDKPFHVEATRNYLPEDVALQPAYTIYEGSKWTCDYKTQEGDSVCCLDSFGSGSPWKYCLLVDEKQNAFAFVELGVNKFLKWSEGKQPIFTKTDNP